MAEVNPFSLPAVSFGALAAVFTVMVALGLGITPRDLLSVRDRPDLLGRGLLSVLVVAPTLAVAATLAFGLDRWLEVGVVLMAIAPGAPVALRRSLGAGSHRSFAPALQLGVAVLAIVTLPAWIAVLNRWYAGHAWVTPLQVARQVFIVQLLPLGLGLSISHMRPAFAAWLQPRLARLANLLLIAVLLAAGASLASAVLAAGPRLLLASGVATSLAVTSGHLLGGPDGGTRTAVAIGSAARNPGLALLVATTNAAPPAVETAILAHFLVSALTLVPYVAWRRRSPS